MAAAVATRRAAPRLRELPGAETAYISPHHKDGLVLVLWISLSGFALFFNLIHWRGAFWTKYDRASAGWLFRRLIFPARSLRRAPPASVRLSLQLCAHFFYPR